MKTTKGCWRESWGPAEDSQCTTQWKTTTQEQHGYHQPDLPGVLPGGLGAQTRPNQRGMAQCYVQCRVPGASVHPGNVPLGLPLLLLTMRHAQLPWGTSAVARATHCPGPEHLLGGTWERLLEPPASKSSQCHCGCPGLQRPCPGSARLSAGARTTSVFYKLAPQDISRRSPPLPWPGLYYSCPCCRSEVSLAPTLRSLLSIP